MNIRNSFIMAPVKTGYSNKEGIVTPKHLHFYQARSKHVGAIIPEPFYLEKGLRELPTQMGIDSDDKIAGLKSLTETIHAQGTKVIAHLSHPGRMANPKIPNNYFVSPTNNACENGGAKPVVLDSAGMQYIKDLFVDAALRAEKANFDFLEIQFGHGYLFAQFISKAVNDRSDEYGGNFDNRVRFPLEVLDAIQKETKLEIIARISADEMTPNGFKIEEMQKFSQILEKRGVSAIHVTAGTVCTTPPWFFQHMFVPKGKTWEMADKIKEVIDIPVIYVGQINEFADIDLLMKREGNNYIAVGRPLIADPDFIGKYLGEIDESVRPCLACSEGCLGGVKSGKGLGCTVNPLVGKEDFVMEKATKPKTIAIVGGGLAGMTAAITLKQRDHTPTIFEKDKLGGQFNLAYLPPHKQSLIKLIHYLENEITENNIKVIHKEATNEDLRNYDEIIIATGSLPTITPIRGLKEYFWAEVLEDHNLPENKRALVVGGGLIGTEIANKLLSKGNTVYIVEMMEEVARGMEMIEKKLTLKNLKENNVSMFVNTTVTGIDDKNVFIEADNVKQTIEDIDHIILATGMKSYNPINLDALNKPVHLIGDARQVGKAQDAIEDAFEKALMV